jgi:hypothetical protein
MPRKLNDLLQHVSAGGRATSEEALSFFTDASTQERGPLAEAIIFAGFGETLTYSRKEFLPLTGSAATSATIAPRPRRRSDSGAPVSARPA